MAISSQGVNLSDFLKHLSLCRHNKNSDNRLRLFLNNIVKQNKLHQAVDLHC